MKTSYRERDYTFGQAILTLRTAIGLTQEQLGSLLNISTRAVAGWKGGSSYPKTQHLKAFIELAVQHQAFSIGHEAQEIRTFWKEALSHTADRACESDPPTTRFAELALLFKASLTASSWIVTI